MPIEIIVRCMLMIMSAAEAGVVATIEFSSIAIKQARLSELRFETRETFSTIFRARGRSDAR